MDYFRLAPLSRVASNSRQFPRAPKTDAARGRGSAQRPWNPAADVTEESARFVVQIDIPGVDPAQIDLSTENGILSVSGERADAVPESASRRRCERGSGRFHRRFRLPDSVDTDGIEAQSRHGVLEIVIPKAAREAARRVAVCAA